MNDTDLKRIVISMLSSSIDGRRIPDQSLTASEWNLVLSVLAAQNVHTFVYDYLPGAVPDDVLRVWKRQVELTEAHNAKCRRLASAQSRMFAAHGIHFALLKGESIAQLYPNPLHRGGSDIDWFFPDDADWKAALSLVTGLTSGHPAEIKPGAGARSDSRNKTGDVLQADADAQPYAGTKTGDVRIEKDSDGDIHYFVDGITVEHHRDWTHLSSRSLRAIAGKPEVRNGQLSPQDMLLMLLSHILHHFAWKGASMKQLVDLAVVLRSFHGKYNPRDFEGRIRSLGIEKWCSLVFSALVSIGFVEAECIPLTDSVFIPTASDSNSNGRSAWGKEISVFLDVIFSDGAFGNGGSMLLRRVGILLRVSPREMMARYGHLISGRMRRLKQPFVHNI